MSNNHIELRIRQLEKRCRTQHRLLLLLLGGCVLLVAGGWLNQAEVSDVVRARQFEVVSGDGTVGWLTGTTNGTGSTAVFNADGKSVWAAGVNNGHGVTQVSHANGKVRCWSSVDEDGNGVSKVWDNDDNVVWSAVPEE